MKKKIIIASLFFLIIAITGITYYIYNESKYENTYNKKITKEYLHQYLKTFDINTIEMRNLPSDIKKTTAKYNLFSEIYNSDNIIFLYGFEKGAKIENISEQFHKNIQEEIKVRNIDKKYKIITINNPEKIVKNSLIKQGINVDKIESCVDTDSNLMNLIMVTAECYNTACIIDNKKNKYINFSKKYPEIIIKALEDYEG